MSGGRVAGAKSRALSGPALQRLSPQNGGIPALPLSVAFAHRAQIFQTPVFAGGFYGIRVRARPLPGLLRMSFFVLLFPAAGQFGGAGRVRPFPGAALRQTALGVLRSPNPIGALHARFAVPTIAVRIGPIQIKFFRLLYFTAFCATLQKERALRGLRGRPAVAGRDRGFPRGGPKVKSRFYVRSFRPTQVGFYSAAMLAKVPRPVKGFRKKKFPRQKKAPASLRRRGPWRSRITGIRRCPWRTPARSSRTGCSRRPWRRAGP